MVIVFPLKFSNTFLFLNAVASQSPSVALVFAGVSPPVLKRRVILLELA